MSNESEGNTTRRGFLGTATAATALTMAAAPAAANAQTTTRAADEMKVAQLTTFPRTPANYGFTVIAKVKPGREQAIRDYGKTIEEAVNGSPGVLAPLRLHYLRWVLFDVGSGLHFMY